MDKFDGFTSIADALKKYDKEEDKYISHEFQQYGYELAKTLGDLEHKGLYIKMAKEEPRDLLENIKYEVLETGKGDNLGKLFMWKLKQARWKKRLKKAALSRQFFSDSPPAVAQKLLQQALVVIDEYGNLRAVEITETEAYLGEEDLASHARFGFQGKGQRMFGPPGRAYIYLIYGQHLMFNVVAHERDEAGAVLVRAGKPLVGGKGKVAVGPGRLTDWLKISQNHNGADLTQPEKIWLAEQESLPTEKIKSAPRVGIDYAEEWADKKLRFWKKYTRYRSAR